MSSDEKAASGNSGDPCWGPVQFHRPVCICHDGGAAVTRFMDGHHIERVREVCFCGFWDIRQGTAEKNKQDSNQGRIEHPFAAVFLVSEDHNSERQWNNADAIVREELQHWDRHADVWQGFAVLLSVRSVGVQGDQRTYEATAALRIVESIDSMTADWISFSVPL
ncbi:MAG: hypothetical protein ISR35_10185 [Planctomycetes bacterium]|nr:hypothetical protein [Planctomycetota bacterium]